MGLRLNNLFDQPFISIIEHNLNDSIPKEGNRKKNVAVHA